MAIRIRHWLAFGPGLAVLVALGSCDTVGTWLKYRSNLSNNGLASDSNLDGRLKFTFPTGGGVMSSPAVDASTIYFGSNDSRFYALDKSGALKWSYVIGGAITSSPAVEGTTVYFGSVDRKVYALDAATGAKKWSFATDAAVWSSPAISTTVIVTAGRFTYGLSPTDGYAVWQAWTAPSHSSAAVSPSGVAIIATDRGDIYGLDPTNGLPKWSALAGGTIDASPAVGLDGTAYLGANDHLMYAINSDTGAVLWTYDTGGANFTSAAVIHDGTNETLYFGCDSGFYAMDVGTHQVHWRVPFARAGSPASSPAVTRNGILYVGGYEATDQSNWLYAVGTAAGNTVWKYPLSGAASSPAVDGDGLVYVGSKGGALYAIQ